MQTNKMIGIHFSEPTGLTSGLPCQPAKSLQFIALGLLSLPRAYLANQQNHWNSLDWTYWAYLGPPCQPAKSWEFIALGLLSLLWAYLANQQNHWNLLL